MQWAFPFFFLETPKKGSGNQCGIAAVYLAAFLTPQSYSQVLGQHTTVLTNTITHSTDSENICQQREKKPKKTQKARHTRSISIDVLFYVLNTQLSASQHSVMIVSRKAPRRLYRRSFAKEAQRESLMPCCLNEYSYLMFPIKN